MGAAETPWQAASKLHTALSGGWALPSVVPPVPGLTPEHGEQAVGVFGPRAGHRLDYARYTGADVVFHHGGPNIVVGSLPFLAGYAAGSVVVRGRARRRAQRLAEAQWRTRQMTYAVVTTHRLWCEVHLESWRWFNFNHDTTTGLQLNGTALTLSFPGDVAPLRISGAWAPWMAVAIAHLRYGRSTASRLPCLAPLLGAATASA